MWGFRRGRCTVLVFFRGFAWGVIRGVGGGVRSGGAVVLGGWRKGGVGHHKAIEVVHELLNLRLRG